jgi:hypothetical protein
MMLSLVAEEQAMTRTLAFILTASLAACAGQAEVRYAGNAAAPELVAMDTDSSVMVVVNADEPVFYSENTYWLYRDNHWYRSSSHRGRWARIDTPPEHIRRIDRPSAYVHFRPGTEAPRTTYNQREQPMQQRPVSPEPTPDQARPDQALPGPAHDPSSQNPAPPYPNPLPPQQMPPSPDHDPTLQRPAEPHRAPPLQRQVPAADPEKRGDPDRQITPDPDRAPTSPGMRNRAPDQRPATDPEKRPEPDQEKRRPEAKN